MRKMNPVKYYDKFTQKFSGNFYCFLSNLKFRLFNIDLTFKYNKIDSSYSATSKNKTQKYFFHTKQASRMYSKGFDFRAKDLFDAYLIKYIKFKKNDFVIDCGANTGDFLLSLPNFINYLGIEPSPLEFESLSRNIGARCKIINCGLWNKEGVLNFFISSQNADSSFIKPRSYTSIKRIPTVRLDKIIKNRKIKLLKIEGEGAEPEIIVGCSHILRNIEYISADLGFERGAKEESTIIPVINYLLSNNFELIDINHKRHVHLFHNKHYKQ